MPLEISARPSPNYGERVGLDGISMLVLHYTGMTSCEGALDRLCDPRTDVSAHFLIDEDGTTYRLVADENRAWHAGHAFWRGLTDINSASIGIELVNPGHEHGYRDFPDIQITALIELCYGLIDKHNIPAYGVVGHSDIAPGRKDDPGELFPWHQLASRQIGLWPDSDILPVSDGTAWDDLAEIGYASPHNTMRGSDVLNTDSAETDVIAAFQRRFLPQNLTGKLDSETLKQISRVRQIYSKSLI